MATIATAIRSTDGQLSAEGLVHRPRIVVIGSGHAGLEACKALSGEDVDVLMVDRNNYHKFQPLLYQVATSGLQTGHICMPVRHIFQQQDNFDFRLATVLGVDLEAQLVHVEEGPPIHYDSLIVGAGASVAYYGVEGAEEHGFPLKNVADAVELRAHVLRCFEEANRNPALIEGGVLNFVIVGGGPTGVEMAGGLRELFDQVLRKDFPGLDLNRVRVILLERADALMLPYKADLQAYTKDALEYIGVDVRLETAVTEVTPTEVRLADGTAIPTQTLIWAAGVRANPLADVLSETEGIEQTRGGRLVTDEYLRLPAHPNVFVAGDIAGAADPQGVLYPQVAQVAIQQGIQAAGNAIRAHRGLDPEAFVYNDLGMMATIGRNRAILELPNGTGMKGFIAWCAWVFVHVVKLAGFRNQLAVFFSWVYSYFTWDRTPRLIIDVEPETDEIQEPVLPVSA
ncbi:MAG: NAD(P)/FAD-dependent oxidoreductase [Bacteroidota bacterium]